MRNPNRIDDFLNKVNNEESINKILLYIDSSLLDRNELILKYLFTNIREYWKNYPDLRFTQVLVNLNFIPYLPGFWYYAEEADLLNRIKTT